MIPLEVRFEDVSGKASIIVTANLADNWRPLGNHFGFYGFVHEKYLEDGLITVRVWVIESPAQSIRAQDGFPLDLQSMGSSPSRALAFRLFNGRLSVGAALGTVINSPRSDGSPGYYKEAVLLAQHAGVSYWLRFYAALNDGHPGMPEWTEEDIPLAEEGTLPRVSDIRELRASNIEDRLSRVSMALDSLEERARTLVQDFQARPDGGPAAPQGNDVSLAEDSEKTAPDLRERWSKEFEKQAETALEKLREEATNSGRAFEESKQHLASLAEAKLAALNQVTANATAGLEAAAANLREEVRDSRRALAESKQQLASVAEAQIASLDQVTANATAGLESAAAKLREEVSNSARALAENRQPLASLTEAGPASLNQPAASAVAGLEAAMAKLREEASDSGQALAESKRELASLTEARLASVNRAAANAMANLEAAAAKLREEFSTSGPTFDENKREIDSLAEAKLALLNQTAANTLASLEAAVTKLREEVSTSGRTLEQSKREIASLAEAKLASLNQVAANAAATLEAARWKLQEEVGNSERALAESKRQLAGLVETRKPLLTHTASSAVADFEAGQRRFRRQYETLPNEPGDFFARDSAEQPSTFGDHGTPSNRRGVVAMLTMAAGLFLIVTVAPWGEIFSTSPPVQMHLQAQAPSDFADQSPYWSAKRRAKEEETAQAYWQAAASSLQMRYPFGSQLPADPAPEFKVDSQYAPSGRTGTVAETTAHYWDKLRACWSQSRFWVESQPEKETLAARLGRVWEQIEAKFE
jgi:hypothetical protein